MKDLVIFITVDWFYPAYKAGGPITSLSNLISSFNKNIRYKIFCSDSDLRNEKLIGIKTDCWVSYNSYTDVWYSSKKINHLQTYLYLIKSTKPAVIYINCFYSPLFTFIPLLFGKAKLKVIAPRGMLHPGAIREKGLKKFFYIRLIKILKISKCIMFHATNAQEKKYISKVFNKARIKIAENFPRKIPHQTKIFKRAGILNLVTIALISPMKNHLKILESLSEIKGKVIYNIYGPIKEHKYWEQCKTQIELLPININVIYHGDTRPENIPKILANNHVYIQPSTSENFGHSLYEAFTSGTPVITSNNTPWKNLMKNNCGVNVNLIDLSELTKSINYFLIMKQTEFDFCCSSAVLYGDKAVNFNSLINEYQELFNF